MARELLCTCGASSANHVDVGAGRFGIYGPCAATGCSGFTAACAECANRPKRSDDDFCSDECGEAAFRESVACSGNTLSNLDSR